MTVGASTNPLRRTRPVSGEVPSPGRFLNTYEITDHGALRHWVNTYSVFPVGGDSAADDSRGATKNAVWTARNMCRDRCRGLSFVVSLEDGRVATARAWDLPTPMEANGFAIEADQTFQSDPSDPEHRGIVAGVLQDAVKQCFKKRPSPELGPLWQDFGDFCQMPSSQGADFLFCRKFVVTPKALRGGRWVLLFKIVTVTVDGLTLADYLHHGEAQRLMHALQAKQHNKLNRANEPANVRLWVNRSTGSSAAAEVVELSDPAELFALGAMDPADQPGHAGRTVSCRTFGRLPTDTPLSQLRLILDTQITGEQHSETILGPEERVRLSRQLRDFLDGADVFGATLRLSAQPLAVDEFPHGVIAPPPLRLRSRSGDQIIPTLDRVTRNALLDRGRQRSDYIRSHGFLDARPIHPLLACPSFYGPKRAKQLLVDLNRIWSDQRFPYKFTRFELYRDIRDVKRHVEQGEYDSAFVVLPESTNDGQHEHDAHERLKQSLDVPSQCIYHDNTLPAYLIGANFPSLGQRERRQLTRTRRAYELCLLNLLTKHHCIPFAPAAPSHFNVQVGLDVGGRHNTHAMACIGVGFRNPDKGLLFRPEHIRLDSGKAEPIPADSLYRGLLHLFEVTHDELQQDGTGPDFDTAVFYRDGALACGGDGANEADAIRRLHTELVRRGWVGPQSTWTAVEVSKSAEGWRIFHAGPEGGLDNPIVGEFVEMFDDGHEALVCTTGAPYLTQGTAAPLKVRVVPIHGTPSLRAVVKDLVWQADLGFTKPDAGISLPWVLHVADSGALQVARSYRVTGITT